MKLKCDYCGNTYEDVLSNCPKCGAPNIEMLLSCFPDGNWITQIFGLLKQLLLVKTIKSIKESEESDDNDNNDDYHYSNDDYSWNSSSGSGSWESVFTDWNSDW